MEVSQMVRACLVTVAFFVGLNILRIKFDYFGGSKCCEAQDLIYTLFSEICAVSRISKKEIGRCFKLILKALETSVDLITTGDFMSRFCSNLGLPKQVQMAATHIARKAVELDLVPGRSPISVAAAAIYMASQASSEKRTQKGKTCLFWGGFFGLFSVFHVFLLERTFSVTVKVGWGLCKQR